MLSARRLPRSGQTQTLLAHAEGVARIAAENAKEIGLSALLRLCGLLHDAGKASPAFQAYLQNEDAQRGTVEHSAYGAIYAFGRWHAGGAGRMLTAELIAFAVASHHGRLPDLVDEDGRVFVDEKLIASRYADQNAVMARYFEEVASPDELDALFAQAVGELERKQREIAAACAHIADETSRAESVQNLFGLVQRSVYSLLIDADRWDAYCFEAGVTDEAASPAPWRLWEQRLQARLAGFPCDTALARLRASVSADCEHAAAYNERLWRLCVPTGGGKTYASMRYALEVAQRMGYRRILYVAPYKAILEQTAKDVRTVFLGDSPTVSEAEQILEQHTNAAPSQETQGDALRRYQLLSQRWNEPLVLTTMVQLLNTIFSGASACARRFCGLQNCVLLLDEAQSIPLRCLQLFNLALQYLCACCGCTVVLCTATQPLLNEVPRFPLREPKPMVHDESALYAGFRRVRLVDDTATERTPAELATRVAAQLSQVQSALCIVNTKATAAALFTAFRESLPPDAPLYCLTTAQCPEHRQMLLNELRALLKARKPVVCVATQLIEAGVDISFGLVVRALAGLDSVVQAAGRCNRNAERALGEVWLVCVAGESLMHLDDIAVGQTETRAALDAFHADPSQYQNDALSPRLVERYFRHSLRVHAGELGYPLKAPKGATLQDLLSSNQCGRGAYWDQAQARYVRTCLAQAFRTAGRSFAAIDGAHDSLLVPYGKGRELIEALSCTDDLREVRHLARAAQRYTVSVFPQQLEKFKQYHCLRELPIADCYALDEAYYDEQLGMQTEQKELPFLCTE